jgi:hypothetical protein
VLRLLAPRLLEVAKAVAPLVLVLTILQALVVQAPLALYLQFLSGAVLSTIGMLLLFVGIDLGILPMGRYIGAELPARRSLWLIVAVAFALGFATTAAEPDVLVLAKQVELASSGEMPALTLTYIIAGGVGLLGLASIGPIIAVLVLALVAR